MVGELLIEPRGEDSQRRLAGRERGAQHERLVRLAPELHQVAGRGRSSSCSSGRGSSRARRIAVVRSAPRPSTSCAPGLGHLRPPQRIFAKHAQGTGELGGAQPLRRSQIFHHTGAFEALGHDPLIVGGHDRQARHLHEGQLPARAAGGGNSHVGPGHARGHVVHAGEDFDRGRHLPGQAAQLLGADWPRRRLPGLPAPACGVAGGPRAPGAWRCADRCRRR